jgi:hypothetical protein
MSHMDILCHNICLSHSEVVCHIGTVRHICLSHSEVVCHIGTVHTNVRCLITPVTSSILVCTSVVRVIERVYDQHTHTQHKSNTGIIQHIFVPTPTTVPNLRTRSTGTVMYVVGKTACCCFYSVFATTKTTNNRFGVCIFVESAGIHR